MTDTPADRLAQATPPTVARRIRGLSDRAIAWIFVAPTIFLLLAINIFPLIWTIQLSFTNYKANRIGREVKNIGLRNYERILTDSDIWLNMQATAHFLFWTIAAGPDWLRACLADQPQLQGQCVLDDDHRVADDALARRGGELLEVSLSAADRPL